MLAGVLVHREFFERREGFATPNPNDPPSYVKDWEKLPSEGIVVGGKCSSHGSGILGLGVSLSPQVS
jgi:hypothetical protein